MMMNEEQLRVRRDQLVDRVNHLVEQIPALQREESAVRGQIMLINEMLGEIPPPPGAVEANRGAEPKKPDGKPRVVNTKKRTGKAASHGKR